MNTFLIAIAFFMFGYLLNIFYITVLYHRALTHKSIMLTPRGFKLLNLTGNWITGIDPKAWALMHRQHHMYSDTELDPHSPAYYGIIGVAKQQLLSYKKSLRALIKKVPEATKLVQDIPFDVNSLNKTKFWFLPYLFHAVTAVVIGFLFMSPIIGIAYYLGIMSHPVQGYLVNSFAHYYGYRNFETEDNSRNNYLIALAVFGEGYQNNHHENGNRAKFSVKKWEVDPGYALCHLGRIVGLVTFKK